MKRFLTASLALVVISLPNISFATSLPNPLGVTSVPDLIGRVINASLSVVGSLALLMFVYGGFMWMLSRGDQKMVQKGKDTLTWATLGLAIIFSAYVLVNTIIKGLVTGSV